MIPNSKAAGFVAEKTLRSVSADTEFTVIPGTESLTLKIRCIEPQTEKIKSKFAGTGNAVWGEDLVEIFFGPVTKDRELSQFVVSAGGGRWMGRGIGGKVAPGDYARWNAKTKIAKGAWTAEVTIPYQLLGWQKRPGPDTVIPFNLCRTRTPVSEVSSYESVGESFHNVKNYAVLWLDAPENWFAARKAELIGQASKLNKDLADKIAKWNLKDPADAYRQMFFSSAKLRRSN